jgi:CIC family chloride channel protein
MKRAVGRDLLTTILREATPRDLKVVGRTLTHAAIVGVAAGLMGAAFFAILELVQRLVLEDLGGYRPLRAPGETFLPELTEVRHFRPWLLALLPAVGALASGIISELAPETRGGGGDAMIDAFHRQDGFIRKRVSWVKALSSIFTLGPAGRAGARGRRCRSAARWGRCARGRWASPPPSAGS